jgi:hypothetical protein
LNHGLQTMHGLRCGAALQVYRFGVLCIEIRGEVHCSIALRGGKERARDRMKVGYMGFRTDDGTAARRPYSSSADIHAETVHRRTGAPVIRCERNFR